MKKYTADYILRACALHEDLVKTVKLAAYEIDVFEQRHNCIVGNGTLQTKLNETLDNVCNRVKINDRYIP